MKWMSKCTLLVALALLVTLSACQSKTDSGDFRGLSWGADVEAIKANEETDPISDPNEKERINFQMESEIDGYGKCNMQIVYGLDENMCLNEGTIFYFCDDNETMQKALLAEYTKLYGEPKSTGDDMELSGKIFHMWEPIWETETSKVKLTDMGAGAIVAIVVPI